MQYQASDCSRLTQCMNVLILRLQKQEVMHAFATHEMALATPK